MSRLTEHQLLAAATTARAVYLEAAPGSGKTTVAAHRFGIQRFARRYRSDPRGVVAVSFTRAATFELRTRVQSLWGSRAARTPHRIITLDALICDLVHVLLMTGQVSWPGGHTALDVRDNWRALVDTQWSFQEAVLAVEGDRVVTGVLWAQAAETRPVAAEVSSKLQEGICTHVEVRIVLEHALAQPRMRQALVNHLAGSMRSLIVDEVFDANPLDLDVIELADDAGANVTLIGDPWQALYRFRGARPELVPVLVARKQMLTLPLSQSFRWRSEAQAKLARRLRAGESVALTPADPDALPDVVLATEWKHLWELDTRILPLAFGAAKGNIEEAGATLLLDFVTRSLLGTGAVYAGDAFATLRIAQPLDAAGRLDVRWPEVIDALLTPGTAGPRAAYEALVDLLETESTSHFRPVRGNYTNRLGWLRERLVLDDNPILGMTIHQAKGREWGVVGLAMNDAHTNRLRGGLSVAEATDRLLYVGCTRARTQTIAIEPRTG